VCKCGWCVPRACQVLDSVEITCCVHKCLSLQVYRLSEAIKLIQYKLFVVAHFQMRFFCKKENNSEYTSITQVMTKLHKRFRCNSAQYPPPIFVKIDNDSFIFLL